MLPNSKRKRGKNWKLRIRRKIRPVGLFYYYLYSSIYAVIYRKKIKYINAFCFFVGYPRSGHTLIGSLLNAHRNILIAHELHALRFVMMGFSREQIFSLLVRRDRWFSKRRRSWNGYSYEVPGQHQGDEKSLYVIGDKKGGGSIELLREHPWVLARLREIVGVPIRVIHHIRNPYDSISTIMRETARTLDEAIDFYFQLVKTLCNVCRELEPQELLEIHHEHFIERPEETLGVIVKFLGLDADSEYLRACSNIVFKKPRRSHRSVHWSEEQIERASEYAKSFSFLKHYNFYR